MDLRTATLLAGIAQSIAVLCYAFNYVHLLGRLSWSVNAEILVMQPVYLLSHIMLAVFLFAFYVRQKT